MTAFFVHLVLTRLSLLDVNLLLHVALLSRLSKLAFAEGIQDLVSVDFPSKVRKALELLGPWCDICHQVEADR